MVDKDFRGASGRPDYDVRTPQQQREQEGMTEEERQRAADQADEESRKHGAAQTRRAATMINQPLAPPITAAGACKIAQDAGERSVLVSVPRNILLTLDYREGPFAQFWGNRLALPAGAFEVPELIANHWWLKAHGVRPYRAPQQADENERTYTQSEVDAMMRRTDVARALRPPGIDPQLEVDKGQGGELGGRGTPAAFGRSNEYGGSGEQSKTGEESRPDLRRNEELERQQYDQRRIGLQAPENRENRGPQHNPGIFERQQAAELEESGEADKRREGMERERQARDESQAGPAKSPDEPRSQPENRVGIGNPSEPPLGSGSDNQGGRNKKGR